MALVIRDQLSLPLGAFVENLYYLEGSMPYRREKVFPSPGFDLKINLGDPLRAHHGDARRAETVCRDSWCVGIWSQHHIVDWPEQAKFIGVTFKPGGAYAVLGIPVCEMHDQIVTLDAVWGGSLSTGIRQQLWDTGSTQTRFDLLERFLVGRLSGRRTGLGHVQYALARMAQTGGSLTIRALSDEVGVSGKRLIGLFRQIVGGTPKELARLYRFSEALDRIGRSESINFTDIAHEGHYFDQAHFCRDFRAFTGETPSDYLRQRRQVLAARPDYANHKRLLAIN